MAPTFEFEQEEVDLLAEAVSTHIEGIDRAMKAAMEKGDRATSELLSKEVRRYNALLSRFIDWPGPTDTS